MVFTLCGCVTTPPPAPNTASLWGYFTLKPREGVKPGGADSSGYSDRRYRDVEYVNYKEPGFAVVYLEGPPSPEGSVDIALKETRHSLNFDTQFTAVGAGGTIIVRNTTQAPHTFSCPMATFMRRLSSGESTIISTHHPGEYTIFVLDYPGQKATIFAAPGPFSVVGPTRRWELANQTSGSWRLRTWHPRFPPVSHDVDLAVNTVQRIDLEVGVDALTLDDRANEVR